MSTNTILSIAPLLPVKDIVEKKSEKPPHPREEIVKRYSQFLKKYGG